MTQRKKQHFHKLLQRQLKKHLNIDIDVLLQDKEYSSFLEAINEAYLNFEADHKHLDRSLELNSEELMRLNKELHRVNEELDRFMYSASHNLKSPLSTILGLINVIKLEINSPENVLKYLSIMESSIFRLTTVLDDLSNFTKNARLDILHEKIDFFRIIELCRERIDYLSDVDKVIFEIESKQRADFYSDRFRIEVLLENFISNSYIYHNYLQEKPYIRVKIDVDKERAFLVVEDNGIGIDTKHHGRIFDMFYRASEDAKGSGMGLYIVKGIVDKLGGKVGFESQKGKGTRFFVEIPNRLNG